MKLHMFKCKVVVPLSLLQGTSRIDGLRPVSESCKRRRAGPLLFDVGVRQPCIYALPVIICHIIYLLGILSGTPHRVCQYSAKPERRAR
jgi:hypothetical protein